MKHISIAAKSMLCIALIFGLAGCATIFGYSSPETLNITSSPEKADVSIYDEGGAKIFTGTTPTSLALEKKKGYFSGKKYTVKIQKDGFKEHSVSVDTRANGWYIGGNLIFGGLIGWLIVDPLTGAMWTLDTNELNVSLEPAQKTGMKDTSRFGVMLLEDVPQHLWVKMVKVDR